ncbi:cytochrome P450 3A9 [Aspergillus udagawae]|uniref:Cytochrome P450 3A9 n=1 Tax=Aspergillus udagawae TaxID=91492 RepID=A0A8H3P1Y3_9EURO|nr:cytochrome P450 3A9 [Aspergillus udagawae]
MPPSFHRYAMHVKASPSRFGNMTGFLNLYGPNLLTCEDQAWAHHRRHTAPTFNEKNSALVWEESIRQMTEMLRHWQTSGTSEKLQGFVVASTRGDLLKFSLNVLSGAGMGVKLPFKPLPHESTNSPNDMFKDTTKPPEGFSFTFRSAVAYMNLRIMTVVLATMVVPRWIPRAFIPCLKSDFEAHRDLETYLRKLISIGKAEKTADGSQNLIQGLLLSRNKEAATGSSKDTGLTDLEIIGNMHIFTIAGHETTATSLRFTLLLLALQQGVQDWLYEGILEAAHGEPEDVAQWDYHRMFPKLITPLCVMLEVLRLYPPVVTVPKSTPETPSPLNYQGKQYLLPPRVNVNLNTNCLHYSEEYWGPEAATFYPQRWDARNQNSFLAKNASTPGLAAPGLEYPTIHKPVRGAFIPFSDGFRACLGKKFAQVEFIAALSVLFRDYKVELADDSPEARKDAERVLRESTSVLTLSMREDVPLRFQRRKDQRCQGGEPLN